MIYLLAQATGTTAASTASQNGSASVGTDYPVALLTLLVVGWLGFLIIKRVVEGDSYVNLRNVLLASLILHLLCAPLQILVVDHFYNGIADWTRYDNQGALLADNLRNGQFTLEGTGINRIVGDGGASVYGGVIMTFVGPNRLAAFFVASFVSFLGTIFFYFAYKTTFPEAEHGRYAVLVFLFPSILFWTADVGKESVMLFALGLVAYGIALILTGNVLGYPYAVVGGAIALAVRPNELLILVVAFAVAMLVRGIFRQGRSFGNPIRIIAAVIVIGGFVVLTGIEAAHFISQAGGSGLGGTLSKVSANNKGVGAGFGSSQVPYSSNPLYYPRDVYTVLFDPLPFQAHSVTQLAAAAENSLILVVIILSFRQIRCVLRASILRPYVLVCVLYSLVFLYAFAALGNLGLITRERTLLLPFMFVVLAIPLAREGEELYPWQLPRRLRHTRDGDSAGPARRPADDDGDWEVRDDGIVAQEWAADPVDETEVAGWSPAEWTSEP